MPDYQVIDTPWIRCPECGKIFKGEIREWEYFPVFADYTNECPHCGYWILESEFEEANTTCNTKQLCPDPNHTHAR